MDIHEIEQAEKTHATEVSGGVAALEANESPLCADTTSQCYIWLQTCPQLGKQTDTQTHMETHRHTELQTGPQLGTQTDTQIRIDTHRHTELQTGPQLGTQTDTQTRIDTQSCRLVHSWVHRQTHRYA